MRISQGIACEAQARELPTRIRWKEVPVGCANVARWCRARSAAQDVLSAHELAVVLADRAAGKPKARVRTVVASRPLPDVTECLRERRVNWRLAQCERMKRAILQEVSGEWRAARGHLPLGFGRQPFIRPPRKGIGLVEAHMANG